VFLGAVRKGMDLDISAFNAEVEAAGFAAGAKAAALAKREAKTAYFMVKNDSTLKKMLDSLH
jgi:hypothetical protein